MFRYNRARDRGRFSGYKFHILHLEEGANGQICGHFVTVANAGLVYDEGEHITNSGSEQGEVERGVNTVGTLDGVFVGKCKNSFRID